MKRCHCPRWLCSLSRKKKRRYISQGNSSLGCFRKFRYERVCSCDKKTTRAVGKESSEGFSHDRHPYHNLLVLPASFNHYSWSHIIKWFPNASQFFANTTFVGWNYNIIFQVLIAVLNSAANPILYYCRMHKYKSWFRRSGIKAHSSMKSNSYRFWACTYVNFIVQKWPYAAVNTWW